ncbi:nucleoside diphosphate kinase regulator [Vibrio alginolyticus]|nr:nucleoside diphosphate kinase regulator [Vibrio alginolyticus]EGR0169417.1 nucleoside diphosphate kinase regulator [Vibrio alginolyticus]EGR1560392.1 nucleoside diphosphate kinase regulator [Vibrio alginolyticus]KIP70810.1 nucleoside diphosphate kinase regulator [Vibrio alginolyticus]KIP85686.1 nucleoside diphosphate kinase regulator [Vibrio alginolyticus]
MIEPGDISIEYAVNNKESVMLLKSSKVNTWKKKEIGGKRGALLVQSLKWRPLHRDY